jgi:hypothetical protein
MIRIPNGSKLLNLYAKLDGSNPINILEPSKGGIGIKLNIAKTRFMSIANLRNSEIRIEKFNLKSKLKDIAKIIFAKGPAIPTKTISLLGFLKLKKFIGTGFAQPKITLEPKIAKDKGKIIVPNISMWARGENVRRPDIFAVGSPSL